MAHNPELEDRIEELTGSWEGLTRKRMFGGLCYLLHGNMAFGIWQDFLIVRAGPEIAEKFLEQEGIHPFDITGRPMKGWVMVDSTLWENSEELGRLLAIGREFVRSLPQKP